MSSIRTIQLRGYKSVRNAEAKLDGLNVVIGPNGAGKSALLDAISLLARVALSPTRSLALPPSLVTDGEDRMSITAKLDDDSVVSAATENIGDMTILRCAQQPQDEILRAMRSWKVYDLSDVGADPAVAPQAQLAPDGSNLGSHLAHLGHSQPRTHKMIRTQFRLRSQDTEPISQSSLARMSAGSLRMLALLALAETHSANEPGLLMVECPEALTSESFQHVFAAYTRSLEKTGHQVITTTHSSYMVDQFEPEDLLITQKLSVYRGGAQPRSTRYSRLSEQQIKALDPWLKDHSLGDLWLKNVIEARP